MQARTEIAMRVIAARGRSGATALEVGEAVTEKWSRPMSKADREAVGLAMVTRLAMVMTRDNRFMLKRFEGTAMAPALRVEDMPSPGFVRVPGGEA